MGDYYTDPRNTNRYDGHDLVNVRASFSFSEKLSVFCRIMNAADKRYAERADFAFGNERFFIGEPHSVFVGVRGAL